LILTKKKIWTISLKYINLHLKYKSENYKCDEPQVLLFNSAIATTWVALPSAGGMGEAASLNIRVLVERRRELAITRDLERRK
jgi:hypothetical protein